MSRPPAWRRRRPGRRRVRPGRRPPGRLSRPYQAGYTAHGFGALYNLLLPGLRGREKREFFNRACAGMVLGFSLGGAMLGYGLAGLPGALVGLVIGLGAGGNYAERAGFFRR